MWRPHRDSVGPVARKITGTYLESVATRRGNPFSGGGQPPLTCMHRRAPARWTHAWAERSASDERSQTATSIPDSMFSQGSLSRVGSRGGDPGCRRTPGSRACGGSEASPAAGTHVSLGKSMKPFATTERGASAQSRGAETQCARSTHRNPLSPARHPRRHATK